MVNIAEAKRYADRIKKGLIKNPFQNSDSVNSLKEFAKIKDEENFKVIIDFMTHFISNAKEGGLKFFKKEPLVFIECLLMTTDHWDKTSYILVQISRGVKVKRPPIGKTQKFFQKLYGNHFFIK